MAELISRRCQGTSLQHTYEHDKQDVSALLSVPIAGPVHAASGAIILYNMWSAHPMVQISYRVSTPQGPISPAVLACRFRDAWQGGL